MNANGRGYPVRTVGEFTNGMADWFVKKAWLQRIGIRGEVSDLYVGRSGILSFKLNEPSRKAVLECVAWADVRKGLPEFANGEAVTAVGSVRVRPDRSQYQLHVELVELEGRGALFLEYERLRKRFDAEGLFDAGRKRPVPTLLRKVALISSRGLGAEDFIRAIERTVPFVQIVFVETTVQGIGAEIDIAEALDRASRLDVDAIVLARGGGSDEDLVPFNREPVVRAIVRALKPVLTAIAHTRNQHLADLAGDREFGTPSLAAEWISAGWVEAGRRLKVAARDLERAVRVIAGDNGQRYERASLRLERAEERLVASKRASLNDCIARLGRQSPQRKLVDFNARLVPGRERLSAAAIRLCSRKAHAWGEARSALDRVAATRWIGFSRTLEKKEAALDRYDPLAPLERGYAIVTLGGRALRDARDAARGDEIAARLHHGSLFARVERVSDDE